MNTEIFRMNQVSFQYPQSNKQALTDVSFSLQKGEITVLCGQSGCGKSTLLRHMKKNQIPFGSGSGEILFYGRDLESLDESQSARQIGFVGQNPETQIITDKVWHELAFGLENLGVKNSEIRRRTAEIAEYFGMSSWFRKSVYELSGGQKQLLNLAAVMVMKPELLVLDEPTSQLDPLGAKRFIQTILQLNQDFGITIMLSEQRLEEVLPIANQLLFMQEGKLLAAGDVNKTAWMLRKLETDMRMKLPVHDAMPAALKVFCECEENINADTKAPLSVREGKEWLLNKSALAVTQEESPKEVDEGKVVLEAKDICFGYDRKEEILKDFSLQIKEGSIFGLLGGNGSGKTTAMKVLCGIYKPFRGRIKTGKKVLYLAQNPKSVFTEITVQDELYEVVEGDEKEDRIDKMLSLMQLEDKRQQNPMDLSGGEAQRLALGKILLLEPEILLLDEPTKGLDAAFKRTLEGILYKLRKRGITIVMVTHDLEFCAKTASHCGLLFDGQVICSESCRDFFADNSFYTTAARRMSRGVIDTCILSEDIIRRVNRQKER